MTLDNPSMLQAFLANRDAPCPACGYNLRGLPGDRCPECNQHLSLRVNLTEPRLGAWITGLVGAACGFGFNALLLFYVVIMFFRMSGSGPRGILGPFIVVNSVGMIVMGLTLLAWVRLRQRFRLTDGSAKVLLILATWLLAAADVTVFAYTIR